MFGPPTMFAEPQVYGRSVNLAMKNCAFPDTWVN